VISGDVGVTKPDPRIFEPALKEAGMQACEVVYVGDTAEDVIGARGAGLIPILIRRQIGGTDPRTLDFSESSDPESPGYVDGVDANVKRVSSFSVSCLNCLLDLERTVAHNKREVVKAVVKP